MKKYLISGTVLINWDTTVEASSAKEAEEIAIARVEDGNVDFGLAVDEPEIDEIKEKT